MNIEDAVAKAFRALCTEAVPEGRSRIVDAVMANEDQRNVVFALTSIGVVDFTEAMKKMGADNWDAKPKEEQEEIIKRLAPTLANKEVLKNALDLIWLGACIGLGLENRRVDEAEEMIGQILQETEYGMGNCALCFKREHLKKWGPNGEPICAPCASKHPEGILNTINKKLRDKFGKNAPQAVSAGIIEGKYSDMKDMTDEQIRSMINHREKDITKYN